MIICFHTRMVDVDDSRLTKVATLESFKLLVTAGPEVVDVKRLRAKELNTAEAT